MSPNEHRGELEGCGANAAPYVLGALTEQESAEFRRHLDSCTICREEVAALQAVTAALPSAVPQLSAPEGLKRRVMAAVREQARPDTVRSGRRAVPRLPRWSPALAALAVLAVVVLLVAGVFAPGGAGGRARVIRAGVTVPGASAVLRLQPGRAQLEVSELPQPGRGRVYEVWLKGSGAPRPAGALFTVGSHGDAIVAVPGVAHGVREVMVTSEPLGGSLHPTRAPVIVARLA